MTEATERGAGGDEDESLHERRRRSALSRRLVAFFGLNFGTPCFAETERTPRTAGGAFVLSRFRHVTREDDARSAQSWDE